MDRREFLKLSAAAGAGLAMSPAFQLNANAVSNVKWGIRSVPKPGETKEHAITSLESKVGRKFALDRNYHKWEDLIPMDYDKWSAGQGRVMYIGWHAKRYDDTCVKWADVAAGKQDHWLLTQAESIKAWGKQIYLTPHHEPENDGWRCGTPAEYRAFYSHVRSIFNTVGVTNVTWVNALMATTMDGRNQGPKVWDPGGYSVLAVDGFNRYPCSKGTVGTVYRSFTTVFKSGHSYAKQHGKKLALGEWGCVEQNACGHTSGDPKGKAKWLYDAASVIKTWPEVEFTSYSDEGVYIWKFYPDTSTPSLNAFKSIGLDPYFR